MREEPSFFYRPGLQKFINIVVPLLCLLSVIAEFFINRHGYFSFDELLNFHGFYGFVSYCFIVITAKALRPLLRREEDYYD